VNAGDDGVRPVDEEYSQALARLILAFSCLGVTLTFHFAGHSADMRGTAAIAGYYAFAVIWAALVRKRPGHSVWRRAVVILGDMAITSFGVYSLGGFGASLTRYIFGSS
jgi:hypothetical protein